MKPQPSPIDPEGIFDGLRWGSIFLGAIVDIGVTAVASIPLVLWYAGPEAFSLDEEVVDRALNVVYASWEFLIASAAVGLAATAYGAYFGARRAGAHYLRHGGWVAVVSALIGFGVLLIPGIATESAPPAWFEALSMGLMLPAGVLGGFVAFKREAAA